MATRLKFDVPHHLYPFEHRFADLGNGIEMHYVDEGEWETLLMLHGNPSWSFLYRKMILRLRGNFRCIAPDYPGFGPRGHDDMRAVWAGLAIAFFFLVPVPVISFILIKLIRPTVESAILIIVVVFIVIVEVITVFVMATIDSM